MFGKFSKEASLLGLARFVKDAGGNVLGLLNPKDGTTIVFGGGSSTVTVTKVAASGANQALTFAASGDKAYDITLNSNCTFTLTGGVAGQKQAVNLIIRQSGAGGFVPNLPAGILWSSGSAPIPNTVLGKVDFITFTTVDAGVTVLGSY